MEEGILDEVMRDGCIMPGAMGRRTGKAKPLNERSGVALALDIILLSGFLVFFVWNPGSVMLNAALDIFQNQSIAMAIIVGVAEFLAFAAFVLAPVYLIIQRCIELLRRLRVQYRSKEMP